MVLRLEIAISVPAPVADFAALKNERPPLPRAFSDLITAVTAACGNSRSVLQLYLAGLRIHIEAGAQFSRVQMAQGKMDDATCGHRALQGEAMPRELARLELHHGGAVLLGRQVAARPPPGHVPQFLGHLMARGAERIHRRGIGRHLADARGAKRLFCDQRVAAISRVLAALRPTFTPGDPALSSREERRASRGRAEKDRRGR